MESVIRLELVFPCDLPEGTRNEFCSDSVVAVNPKTRPSGSKWSLVDTRRHSSEKYRVGRYFFALVALAFACLKRREASAK